MPKVYNLKKEKTPQSAIYIGRPSIFGNPYTHLKGESLATVVVSTRQKAVDDYGVWFYERIKDPTFKDAVEALRGHDLACWCKPLPCHGDIILEYLEGT